MTHLADMKFAHSTGEEKALTEAEIQKYKGDLPNWNIIDLEGVKHLERVFRFPDFSKALAFTNQVGALAEKENHHPAILTEWGKVTVRWWTHKVHGLHLNDFIMAAKTDGFYSQ